MWFVRVERRAGKGKFTLGAFFWGGGEGSPIVGGWGCSLYILGVEIGGLVFLAVLLSKSEVLKCLVFLGVIQVQI